MPEIPRKQSSEVARLRAEVKRLRARVNLLSSGLETLLNRRGFAIYKKEPSEKLLLPAARGIDAFYRMMRKYSFRLFLRDVIKYGSFTLQDVTRYASLDVTKSYCEFLAAQKMVRRTTGRFAVASRVTSFGETLEWYIAEILRREFGADAVWGVKFRRPRVGGDYDVIAQFEGSLLYAEVKSSPPKQIYDSEIAAFLDRVDDLSPEIAVFFMDTELRMKDKIVPMFEQALKERSPEPPPVNRLERELFQAGDRIFVINSKDDVVDNLRAVFSRYYRATGGQTGAQGLRPGRTAVRPRSRV